MRVCVLPPCVYGRHDVRFRVCEACVWRVCGVCVWRACVAWLCGALVACLWRVCGVCVACVWRVCVACVCGCLLTSLSFRITDAGFGSRVVARGGSCPVHGRGGSTPATGGNGAGGSSGCLLAVSAPGGARGGAVYTLQLTPSLSNIVPSSAVDVTPPGVRAPKGEPALAHEHLVKCNFVCVPSFGFAVVWSIVGREALVHNVWMKCVVRGKRTWYCIAWRR